MKLQYKIAFMIFGFGSLFLVTVTSLSYFYNRSNYVKDLHVYLQDIARERSAHVVINLKERAIIAASFSNVPVIVEALEHANAAPTGIPLSLVDSYTTNPVAIFLRELMARSSGEYGKILLTDRHGKLVAATGDVSLRDQSNKYWWKAAFFNGKGRIFFDDHGYDSAMGGYVVGVVVPIIKNNEIIGILRCNVNISGKLLELVEGIRLGETGELKIVKSGGAVVLKKDREPSSLMVPPELVEAMKKREAGSAVINEGRKSRFIAYVPIAITAGSDEYGFGGNDESIEKINGNRGEMWFVFLSQDLDEALFPLHDRLRGALFIGLLTIVMMGLLSVFFGRRLALPVIRMEELAKKIGAGNFDVRMEVRSKDEMGQLAASFNRMAQNLRETTISRDLLAKEALERREAEEKLISNEGEYRELWQQFQAILKAITDSLVLLSPELDVIWSNGEGGHIADQKCYNIWCTSSEPCKECPPLKSFETGLPEECRMTTDDGKVWDIRSFPIMDSENRVGKVIEVVSDMTEKVRLGEEIMRAGQLASVGELAAGVAHEINNPINGIINLAQLLVDENPTDDKDREIYDWIISEGNRITVIVNELLSFARKSDGEKKTLKVDDIIINSLTLTKAQMEKEGIAITVDISGDLPEIIGNEGQLKQVLLNIINNARYALNKRYSGWDKNKILEISAEKINIDNSPYMKIVFCDRGIGIPMELQAKIVSPFFSTKPEGEGTGLGLSISLDIVKDHGGTMVFDSVEGEFTRVVLELPLNETPE